VVDVTGRESPRESLETKPQRSLEPWILAERYGDYRSGFWLLFRSGDRCLEIEVTKEQWDSFGA